MKVFDCSCMLLLLATCFLVSTSSFVLAHRADSSLIRQHFSNNDVRVIHKLDACLAESDQPLPAVVYIHVGSAGDYLSLWVALHDDSAEADSDDLADRHSKRMSDAVRSHCLRP